jgi:CRISPR locus-related DNA-binding protein
VLLGFDVGHAVASLLNFKPSALVVAVASVDGSIDPRAAAAYSHLEQLALMARTRCTRLDVEVLNVEGAVEALRETLTKLAGEGVPVVVDVGGGMRLLVLEALLAVLSLPNWLRDVVKVVAYLEGTTRYVELDYGRVSRIVKTLRLQGRGEELTYVDRKVLEVLERRGRASLQQIYEELVKQGISTSKQNVSRILNKLRNKGYVRKIERGVYARTPP